jgi:chromate transporter
MREVFLTFLRLGLTSFGGPIAHLGYFRREFIERQHWIDEALFAQIVAFCSILPGPTSSQVGMIVGLLRAGPGGAFCAWLGFTLPSAVVLERATPGTNPAWLTGALAGLTAAATAIVAQAVLGMAKTQCADPPTQTIAAGAAALAVACARAPALQWLPIAVGALCGAVFLSRTVQVRAAATPAAFAIAVPRGVAAAAAVLFVTLVLVVVEGAHRSPTGLFLGTIVRAGSLVFGGGHVVLPLLQSLVPAGVISARDFYAGYGAAQAVPGPLFTFAAFLGAANRSPLHGAPGAAVATGLIFLPSFLLVFALLPGYGLLRANRAAAAALRGANAAVVGLLGALLYSPLIVGLGSSVWRIALALAVFVLVAAWNAAPWIAVIAAACTGGLAAAAGFAV